jgi:hypothetical protein
VEDEHRSLVIERHGTPRAVLLSIREYVRLAAPEPEVLRIIGEESKRFGGTETGRPAAHGATARSHQTGQAVRE